MSCATIDGVLPSGRCDRMADSLTLLMLFVACLATSPASGFLSRGAGLHHSVRQVAVRERSVVVFGAEEPSAEPVSAIELLSRGESDPFVAELTDEVRQITGGAGLDSLMNPAKVVNLERELIALRAQQEELEALDSRSADDEELLENIRVLIDEKEATSYREKRMVMKGWLRSVFRGQALLCAAASLLLVYDAVPVFGHQELYVRVLGYWSWWLFTIPSLRSIKPLSKEEKTALDVAFFATLVASVATPTFTKDLPTIWWVDFAVVAASYAYGFTLGKGSALEAAVESADADSDFDSRPPTVGGAFGESLWRAGKFVTKALDVGGGQERGVRSEEATALEKSIAAGIEARAQEAADAKEQS